MQIKLPCRNLFMTEAERRARLPQPAASPDFAPAVTAGAFFNDATPLPPLGADHVATRM
jgi:hypothetical protein